MARQFRPGQLQTGSLYNISSSYAITASYSLVAQTLIGSVTSASYAATSSYATLALSASYTLTASYVNPLIQDVQLTGSLNITGSTTQIGTNTLLGSTTLSGSIIISGSTTTPSTPTIKVYGDMETDGVIKFMPVSKNIDTSISASYVFVSGSTNDLYFSQNGSGYNNVTRLRWLEGNLYTGLLHGGLISTASSTTFNVSSGSGIVVNLNASLTTDPFPTIQFVNWGNLTNQPLTYRTSAIQTFIGINSSGSILQQTDPWNDGQYNTSISLGTVLHQNLSTINGTITYPNTAYGYKQRTYDFIKAFGPLKLSGYTLYTSSSLGLTVGSGTAFADGRNYQVDPNNPSYIVDTGTSVSKIFRYYVSASTYIQDTNGGVGYTVIDPTLYNNNGVLTSVPSNKPWSNLRVFYYPNSVTKGIVVYYGSATYASNTEAIANLPYENFAETPNTQQNAIYLGAITIRYNGVFTNPSDYTVLPGGIFRSVGGSGGGGAISTLLSGLSDVIISGPTNGQPLVYDTTAAHWKNSSTLTATLTGNASTATTASYAQTASFVQTSQTASYVLQAVSASYYNEIDPIFISKSGSFATTSSNVFYGNQIITGSILVTGSNTIFNSDVFNVANGSGLYTFIQANSAGVVINDANGILSINSQNRQLYLSNGSTVVVDWENRRLSNTNGVTVDWETKELISTGNRVSVDWENRELVASNGLDHVLNWNSTSSAWFSGSVAGTASFANNAMSSSYAVTASYALNSGTGGSAFPYTGSAQITGSLGVTGSISVTFGITGSLFGTSSWSNNAITASYVQTAQTASYVLNSISSSFTTTASYAVSASYAPDTTFPYTGSAQITGSLVINNFLSTAVQVTANAGATTIYVLPTASYDGAWFEYSVRSGSNARAGQITSIWSGSQVNFTETTTTDFGTTTDLTLGVFVIGGDIALTSSAATSGWTIKTIIRSL